MWSSGKKVVFLLIGLAALSGFGLMLITALFPSLAIELPLVSTLLKLWMALMVVLAGVLFIRLVRSDQSTAIHRKDKYSPGWQLAEQRKEKNMAHRYGGYSRAALLRERQQAEREARQQAEERAGVEVQFRPPRGGGQGAD